MGETEYIGSVILAMLRCFVLTVAVLELLSLGAPYSALIIAPLEDRFILYFLYTTSNVS